MKAIYNRGDTYLYKIMPSWGIRKFNLFFSKHHLSGFTISDVPVPGDSIRILVFIGA